MKRIPARELRLMAEFMGRAIKAQEDAIEDAKRGAPTPGRAPRGRPQPGDTIVDGKMDNQW